MKTKTKKTKTVVEAPVHLVGLMLTFSNVVADMKTMTSSMEILAKKLDRAMRNGTIGSEKGK